MRQKLSKQLRRLAGELTSDHTLVEHTGKRYPAYWSVPKEFMIREWHKNSVVANYRKLKRLLNRTPRPQRNAEISAIRKLVT